MSKNIRVLSCMPLFLVTLFGGCTEVENPGASPPAGEESVEPGVENPEEHDDADVYPPSTQIVETTIVMGGVAAVGHQRVRELETLAQADCSAGVGLAESEWSGIMAGALFIDRNVGTATTSDPTDLADPIPGVSLSWSATDPEADGETMTDYWDGTFVIAEWSDDRIVIDLVDGLHCDLPDRLACVQESGTLTYSGLRTPSEPWENSRSSGLVDVASGELICGVYY